MLNKMKDFDAEQLLLVLLVSLIILGGVLYRSCYF
jgi:hypothetical protein